MKYNVEVLKNGLQVVFVDTPGSTAATSQIWFKAGSALEDNSNLGIAHFLEHMFFKGTPKRPGAKIAKDVESFGGEINAFTSFDYTCYYINSPATNLLKSVEILMDMVSNPKFSDEDFPPEIGVVFEEYRRSQDNPNQLGFQKIQKKAFTGTYSTPILGTENSIKSFHKEQLLKFRSDFYNLQNAFLVVAGDLKSRNKIVKAIEGFSLPNGKASSFPKFKLKSKDTLDVWSNNIRMSQMTICIQAPNYSKQVSANEDLALNALGFGESSKMYKELVLKDSIANSSSCSTMFLKDGGVHFIKVTFPHENLKKVLKRFEEVIKSSLNEGFKSKDIEKIKNQYIASKVYERETAESFAFSLGHSYALSNDFEGEEKFISRIKNSSLSDVNGALNDILSRALHISVQIPKGESEKETKKIVETFRKNLSKISSSNKKAILPYKVKEIVADPQVKLLEIKKGVKLLYRQNKLSPTFVLHAYLKGGITEETPKDSGIYHMLSALMTKGYSKVSYEKIKEELESLSASLNSFSGKNAYGLTMHGQSDHFSKLLKHFTGALLTPDFPETFLSHEKKMTKRILENQKEDPIKQCFSRVSKAMFGDHPYSYNILGNAKTLSQMTRKKIQDRHKDNLKNKDLLITYCGDKDIHDVLEELSNIFNAIPARKKTSTKKKKITPGLSFKEHVEFDREQTQIFIGTATKELTAKEHLYLKMLTTHLSGQSSELFVEVRDRQGLCYSAQPIHFTALEGGYWGIYMASGHDKVERAKKAIYKIIDKTCKDGLSKASFNRIKKMLSGQAQLNLQTNDDYANSYSIPTLHGLGADFFHKQNNQAQKLTHEEFQKGIKKILSQKFIDISVGRN